MASSRTRWSARRRATCATSSTSTWWLMATGVKLNGKAERTGGWILKNLSIRQAPSTSQTSDCSSQSKTRPSTTRAITIPKLPRTRFRSQSSRRKQRRRCQLRSSPRNRTSIYSISKNHRLKIKICRQCPSSWTWKPGHPRVRSLRTCPRFRTIWRSSRRCHKIWESSRTMKCHPRTILARVHSTSPTRRANRI